MRVETYVDKLFCWCFVFLMFRMRISSLMLHRLVSLQFGWTISHPLFWLDENISEFSCLLISENGFCAWFLRPLLLAELVSFSVISDSTARSLFEIVMWLQTFLFLLLLHICIHAHNIGLIMLVAVCEKLLMAKENLKSLRGKGASTTSL